MLLFLASSGCSFFLNKSNSPIIIYQLLFTFGLLELAANGWYMQSRRLVLLPFLDIELP